MRIARFLGKKLIRESSGGRRRAAIIGAGRIAGSQANVSDSHADPYSHAAAMKKNRVSIVAVQDASYSKAVSFIQKWGGEAFSTLADLLKKYPSLDIIVIASPDRYHASQASEVLRAPGAPRLLIIEKPPVVNEREWGQVNRIASSQSKTRVVVNMSRRFDTRYAEAAAIIKSGKLGKIVSVDFTYYGGWLHNGVHAVDVICHLLNEEIEVVSVTEGAPASDSDPCLDVKAVLGIDPKVQINFNGFNEGYFQCFELEIRFSGGRIRFENFGRQIIEEIVEENELGERELGSARFLKSSKKLTSMDHLYKASCDFIDNGDARVLECASLKEISMSMKVIFDAIKHR